MMKQILALATLAVTAQFTGTVCADDAAPQPLVKKEKLQIVFLFGQSNMVGLADASTAWYMTQAPYVPPRELATHKSRYFDWNFYWSGVQYYQGPHKDELDALVDARRDLRRMWRQRLNGVGGIEWDEAAWGEHPGDGRGNVYPFLDQKAEEAGIYARIAAILDAPENRFTVNDAYDELIQREAAIADDLARVRSIYLGDATAADFDAFDAAVEAARKDKTLITSAGKNQPFAEAEKYRALYAALAQEHVNLPIARRTHIYGYGAIAGSDGQGIESATTGPLSVGYGGGLTKIGPEYGVGITLERLVDAPILLVKCSWGNTSIADAWRTRSLDGVETPIEKATREAWNAAETERLAAEGRVFKPRPAPTPTGELSWCWRMTMPQVEKVLADPGQFHPDYDPAVGYEVAGLIWFQGYSDKDNPAYGELLAALITDFRETVKTPDMPVVAGSLGMVGFESAAFAPAANRGMVQAAVNPELKGRVDVVNTAPYYPQELDLWKQVRDNTEKGSPEYETAVLMGKRATSNVGFHYHGSAKCFILMGDAMARSLANMMAGGEPTILATPITRDVAGE